MGSSDEGSSYFGFISSAPGFGKLPNTMYYIYHIPYIIYHILYIIYYMGGYPIWVVIKINVLFWSPKYKVPHSTREPKRDHTVDSHPYTKLGAQIEKGGNLTWESSADRGTRQEPVKPSCLGQLPPAPSTARLGTPNHHLIESIRPLIEVHWGFRQGSYCCFAVKELK